MVDCLVQVVDLLLAQFSLPFSVLLQIVEIRLVDFQGFQLLP